MWMHILMQLVYWSVGVGLDCARVFGTGMVVLVVAEAVVACIDAKRCLQ